MSSLPPPFVPLASLLEQLRSAVSFEEAASHTLGRMLEACETQLQQSGFATQGKIVRGVVHLRPGDGYRGLAVLEAGAAELSGVDAAEGRLTSTTAWRWVVETGRSVSIDVTVGQVLVAGKTSVADKRLRGEFASQESRALLLRRDVTHLHVAPLRGPRGSIDGMISLEAQCRSAMGTPFIWPECSAWLELLADVAAPFLVGLPPRPARGQAVDAYLPVVGASMAPLVEMLRTFAQQEEPILITGPTGAGKSRLARWCHEQSPRRGRPFEVLDLSAVPEELQMAELFGWKRGAFTGAVRDNPGYIARARGGSVFIDEIDNLSPRAQAGLLHVLEERTYRTLGDDGRETQADVRFLVGTNAALQTAVREKRFREDLYYRINVLPVRLPELRERADEIPLWAQFMAQRRHQSSVPDGQASLSEAAQGVLAAQRWPGNLRQLDNIVRRAYALAAMEHGGRAPRQVTLDVAHVRHAMTYEGTEEQRSAVESFLSAATAFVSAAEAAGGALDLDLTEGFKGLVLGAATEKLGGNRDAAFTLFGKDKLTKNRNHHKVFRRELVRAEELCRALGEPRFPFAALSGDGSGEGEPSE